MKKLKLVFLFFLLSASQSPFSIALEEKTIHQETDQNRIIVDKKTGLRWQDNDYQQQLNWLKALRYCNDLSLENYSDWRLPSKDELNALYPRKNILKFIANKWFKDSTSVYWTSTTTEGYQGKAWAKSFVNGNEVEKYKTKANHIRCVQGGTSFKGIPAPIKVITIDNRNNLNWQDNYFEKKLSWEKAQNYCQNLSLGVFSYWRLPTIQELLSLKKLKNKLEHYLPSVHWASNISKRQKNKVWCVEMNSSCFTDSCIYDCYQSKSKNLRCVRQDPLANKTINQIKEYIIDDKTGISWENSINIEELNWRASVAYCSKLRIGGFSDWRLPSKDELIMAYASKINFQTSSTYRPYWSLTAGQNKKSHSKKHLTVNFQNGKLGSSYNYSNNLVRCLRKK